MKGIRWDSRTSARNAPTRKTTGAAVTIAHSTELLSDTRNFGVLGSKKGIMTMMEMTAEATAQILDNLLQHGKFNVMTTNAIENAVRLLKEYPVTCKDCWKREYDNCPFYESFDYKPADDWFCADGVKR